MMIIKIVRGFVVLLSVILIFILFCDLFNIDIAEVIDYFKTIPELINNLILCPKLFIWDIIPLIVIFIIVVGIALSFLFTFPGDVIFVFGILIYLGCILFIKSDPIDVLVFNGHGDISDKLLNCYFVKYDYLYLTALVLMFIFKKYLDRLNKLSDKLNDIMTKNVLLNCLITSSIFFATLFFVFVGWISVSTNINMTYGNNIDIFLVILSIILFGISLFLYKKED